MNNAISLNKTDPISSVVGDDTIGESKGETETDPLNLNPGDVLQVAIYNGPRWNSDDSEKYEQIVGKCGSINK